MKPTKQTLTLRRRGEFTIRTRGDAHCGIGEPTQAVRYSVEVECEHKLDDRGFLFEQRNVDAFFQSLGSTKRSCELLTEKCANTLIRMIKEENPECHIRKISVMLCPAPYAADMTYTAEF